VWSDHLYANGSTPENSGAAQTYLQYVAAAQTRLNVVYAGSNDGLLHGFRTGSFDASGNYVANSATPNDGQEVLAYMPGAVLQTIHNSSDSSLDFSNTQYGHNFFVDATPGTGDLFYGGKWHTWLVGGLGPGGAALYALDVSDPSAGSFVESNAANVVIGEWTAATLTCTNVAYCGNNLGNTYGVPQIRRLHNGTWAAIFGNGFGSGTGDAGIFIMTVDPKSAARTFYYLGTGKAGSSDGIAYVTPADLDGDHLTDYVYAGDLLGNLWRFDLTSNNPSSWAAATAPLFTTQSGQPITTKVVVASGMTQQGPQRLLIAFGTGQKTPLTNTTPVSYIGGTQDIYGVWDWNMTGWNSLSTARYASLSGPYTLGKTNLQQQTVTVAASGNRDITANSPVCWQGSTECGSNNTQFGWYLDLPGTAEQIVFNPELVGPAFTVNSTVPALNSLTACTSSTDAGFTYALSVMSGGAFTNAFPHYNDTVAAGVETDATGTAFVITTANGSKYLVYETVLNTKGATQLNVPASVKTNRLTWAELR